LHLLSFALLSINRPVEKKEDAGCKDVVLKLIVDHPSSPITCYGQGRSKQQAKIASAKYALKRIGEISM
jgi:dsRNA-specific ribonuclease